MKHLLDRDYASAALRRGADALGLDLADDEVVVLLRHLELVLAANEYMNLTRISEPDRAVRLHLVDSLSVWPEIEDAVPGKYVDLGAGAGYPGIPLAIVTGRETILVESIGKKSEFLDSAVKDLCLEGRVRVYAGRSEALALECPRAFALGTARAVAPLPSLLELASPLLECGGMFIALKGDPDESEVRRGDEVAAHVGFESESIRRFVLPGGRERRTVLRYRKCRESEISLPRAEGRAQRRPLG